VSVNCCDNAEIVCCNQWGTQNIVNGPHGHDARALNTLALCLESLNVENSGAARRPQSSSSERTMNAGPGRPSGGGGGRRRRRGRRPNNQRGQRPGGAQARHNQDGIYTAPMDHSYRAALSGNGNGQGGRRGPRPGFAAPFIAADPEPLPAREDASSRIFAFVDDLFFQAKIQETARKLNVKVEFAKTDKDLADRMEQNGEEKPSLIIFDLNNAGAKPLTLIPKLKTKLKKGTSIVGFLSHVQGDLKQKAHEAGCDMVLPRSAFSQNLPQLLRRHGAPEEGNPAVQ
jgi:CheY-like chemotaxis protein